jgi:two-component system sensor histidine kinase KdpD
VLIAPDDLPLLEVDPVHLEQALTNLLENAAKYAPPETPIDLRARLDKGAIEFAIVDRGPGIPAGERERVFDKFYRLGRDGRRASGTGLGLAITRGLIEANGGRVWVEATPGGGATFRFAIPLGGVVPARPTPASVAGRGPA